MKKNLLLVIAFAVMFVGMNACKSKVEAPAEVIEEIVAPVEAVIEEATSAADALVNSIEVPTFESPEVNEFVAAFKTLMTEYAALKGTGNETAAAELAAKFTSWSEGAADIAGKIKPDEMQKFNDFIGMAEAKFNEMKSAAN